MIFSIVNSFSFSFSHTWYQSESTVVVVVPIRNLQRENVHVESTEKTLKIDIEMPTNNVDFHLQLDLAYPIKNEKTDFKLNTANVEIRLYKVDAIQWTSLDAQHKPNVPPGETKEKRIFFQ